MKSSLHTSLLAALLCALSSRAVAHDCWIQPKSFRPTAGEVLPISLLVGHPGHGDSLPRDSESIVSFVALGPSGETDIVGREGGLPAGYLNPRQEGVYRLGVRTHPKSLAMEPAKFHAYLEEEGLEWVIAERERLSEAELPGRERFSRCAKSIVLVGSPPSEPQPGALGFPLELFLAGGEARSADGRLVIELQYEGKPLEGAMIRIARLDAEHSHAGEEHSEVHRLRTDAAGQVGVDALGAGEWLATSVHMLRVEDDPECQWESLWASLSFELSAPAPRE